MNKFSQSGKGLSGFFFGLILATVIIAGILFYLNQTGQNAFKSPLVPQQQEVADTPKPATRPKEEAARPDPVGQDASSEPDAALPEGQADEEETADKQPVSEKTDETESEADRQEQETPKGQKVHNKAGQPDGREKDIGGKVREKEAGTVKKQPVKPSEEAGGQAAKEKKKAGKEKAVPQPTPEQILNSGSIEKARSAAAKEGQKPNTPAKAEVTHYLQMGAYADRQSAEGQRAKLAILGVPSKVVGYQAGHKTLYRVQSGNMSADAVKKMQDDLKKHGVASLIRAIEGK